MGFRLQSRRLFGRLCCRCRSATLLWRDRLRHWRFCPSAGRLLRHHWTKTDLRTREHLRRHTSVVVPGPRGPDDAHGDRCRFNASGNRGLRRAGRGQHRCSCSRLRCDHRGRDLLVAAWYSTGLLLRGSSSRNSGGHGSGSVSSENTHPHSGGRRAAGD